MNDLPAKRDIEKISFEILRGSKSLDVFPTPVDQIVAYSELVVRNDIDISSIHHSYIDKANSVLKRALSKVRGLFDRIEKTIYLDLSKGFNRKSFVKLHETAHGILPWQRKIHDILGDDDNSLNPDYNDEFEAEANFFASLTIFQHDRFIDELSKLNLGIEAAMHLAKHFGASIHASLRRFVDCSNNRCALIILEDLSRSGTPSCALRNFIASKKFSKEFGEITLPPRLECCWAFVQDYCYRRKFKKDGLVTLTTEVGEINFTYQFFFNGYNAFVFLYPVGEKKSSRTKIVISQTLQ